MFLCLFWGGEVFFVLLVGFTRTSRLTTDWLRWWFIFAVLSHCTWTGSQEAYMHVLRLLCQVSTHAVLTTDRPVRDRGGHTSLQTFLHRLEQLEPKCARACASSCAGVVLSVRLFSCVGVALAVWEPCPTVSVRVCPCPSVSVRVRLGSERLA